MARAGTLQSQLRSINVSDPKLYQDDTWRPLFAKLRREDPVHFCEASRYGPYWSVTRYDDIVTVELDHEIHPLVAVVVADAHRAEREVAIVDDVDLRVIEPLAHVLDGDVRVRGFERLDDVFEHAEQGLRVGVVPPAQRHLGGEGPVGKLRQEDEGRILPPHLG